MRIGLSSFIALLILFSATSAQSQDPEVRRHERNFQVMLFNLESVNSIGQAISGSERGGIDGTIDGMIQQYLVDHKAELERLLADNLGKEFKQIDVVAGQFERGRSIPFPEKNEALNFGMTVTGISKTPGSYSRAAAHFRMLFRPAVPQEHVEKIELQFQDLLAKQLPRYSPEYLRKFLETTKAELETWLREAQQKRDELTAQLDKLRQHDPIPVEKAAEQLIEIDRQLLSARLSAAGLEARELAIEEHIARFEKQDLSESDKALLANLQKIYELRQENLKRVKAVDSAGTAYVADQLQKAETDVLSAKMEYEKAKSAARGAERRAVLNAELTKVAIDKAEATARLKFLEAARKETAASVRTQEEATRVSKELSRINQNVENFKMRLERLKAAPAKIDPVEVETAQNSPFRSRRGD